MEQQKTLALETALTMVVDDCTLHVIEGPYRGTEIRMDQELLHIGRSDWCDITLNKDRHVSSHHCRLHLTPEGVRIKDMQSKNGTFLGGLRILEAFLPPGTPLKIGDTVFELRSSQKQKGIDVRCADGSGSLVGKSERMREIFALLERLARRDIPVLLLGETGTGKTSIARSIHDQSKRKTGPFVSVNCGTISPSLIEASLFGHEKGAFTGAGQRHRGYFEQSHQGTLFLDEIGELPLDQQVKLLDVVESRKIRRVGGEESVEVDFRLITATHRDLQKEVSEGRFREDLYYRLSTLELEVPPLRSRLEDIPLLAEKILRDPKMNALPSSSLSKGALERLQEHLWPGNIRELRNVIERALTFLDKPIIEAEDIYFSPASRAENRLKAKQAPAPSASGGIDLGSSPPSSPSSASLKGLSLAGIDLEALVPIKDTLEQIEKIILESHLKRTSWDLQEICRDLDISKSWLYERIKRHHIKKD